ncbi:MAG: hypothetical protein WKG06_17770 [Segetibacter sp.]
MVDCQAAGIKKLHTTGFFNAVKGWEITKIETDRDVTNSSLRTDVGHGNNLNSWNAITEVESLVGAGYNYPTHFGGSSFLPK